MSELQCIAQGCTRPSRGKRRPTLCSTCYHRKHTDASPKFPAQPLLDYMEKRGKSWGGGTIPKNMISLERMDAICTDILEVHPSVVYGDLYFQECVG